MPRIAITKEQTRPTCNKCLIRLARKNGKSKQGFQKYSKECVKCHKRTYNLKMGNGRRYGYNLHKKDICEICGFIPEHSCQLDVDHIDGDRSNDAESNLQTLCANCHRLKTHIDYINNNCPK